MRLRPLLLSVPLLLGLSASSAQAAEKPLEIPYSRVELANGLTVLFHVDHTLPTVAVNMMVKVGSHFEDPGRTGFAHLFEHLMFMGTSRVPTKMFDVWMAAGGGSNNAWTSEDRTDYHDIGPANTLPLLLWLEADRFSSLGQEMNQKKLDAQRDVVRNERRQTSENRPYGQIELRLPELLYPPGHPYHHPVIGSHDDLVAATVDDVKAFFARFYVPSNMALAVAGDFDPKQVTPEIERMFGWIPKAPVPVEPKTETPKLPGVVRATIEEDVTLPKIVMAWHSPAYFAPGDAELDLLASILRKGKGSRLYKALVYDHPLAQEVTAEQHSQDKTSYFTIEAVAQPGVSLDTLEAAIDSVIQEALAAPPKPEEVARAQNQYETAFVSRLESLEVRASLLNQYLMSVHDPGFVDKDLGRYRAVTPAAIHAVATRVLDPKARVILRDVPRSTPPSKDSKDPKEAK